MADNVVLFGWNRPLPGRERLSAEPFQEFVQFLQSKQEEGAIQSFDTVFLEAHGGDLNGFFLIRGDAAKLDTLLSSNEWVTHVSRALHHLQDLGCIRGVTGNRVMERMKLWTQQIPE